MSEEKVGPSTSSDGVKKKRKYLFLDRFNMYANEIDYRMEKIWGFNYWHASVTVVLIGLVIYCIISH